MKPIYQKKFIQTYSGVERRDVSLKATFSYLILIVAIMIIILFYVWQKVTVNRLGFEIGELERQERELTEKNQDMKLKREMLRSLDRIERVARERLGMKIPDKVKLIPISSIKNSD